MGGYKLKGCLQALLLTALFAVLTAFPSMAGAVTEQVPVSLQMDVNSRRTSVYDGYGTYVEAVRASEYDTFTVSADSGDVVLSDIKMNYYIITYNGVTSKYLECTVNGLEEGKHYPVIRPETAEREKEAGCLYDTLERCYMIELCRGDERSRFYFSVFPEEEMAEYRRFYLGNWEQDGRGYRYRYREEYFVSWAYLKDAWYYFGKDGYMLTGWQQYKGNWYYLDRVSGAMKSSCVVDGYRLDENGVRLEKEKNGGNRA